jgi:20S proteasome alpha/beta subunit
VGALIIGGYDTQGGGQVFGCPIGGTLAKENWAIDGSGSTYIWGYCDATYRLVLVLVGEVRDERWFQESGLCAVGACC